MAKLKEQYNEKIVPALEEKLGTKNRMLVPRLQKVVINILQQQPDLPVEQLVKLALKQIK